MRLQGTLSIVACTVATGSSRRILLVTLSLFFTTHSSFNRVSEEAKLKKFYLHGVLFVEIYPWQISHLCRPGTTIVVYSTSLMTSRPPLSSPLGLILFGYKVNRKDYTIEFLLYVSFKLRSVIFLDISVVSWRYFSI